MIDQSHLAWTQIVPSAWSIFPKENRHCANPHNNNPKGAAISKATKLNNAMHRVMEIMNSMEAIGVVLLGTETLEITPKRSLTLANKMVMSLDLYCDKCKKVALHCVTKIEGMDSMSIDMKERTLIVIGDADPLCVANFLRIEFRCAKLLSVRPVSLSPAQPKEKKAIDEKNAGEKKMAIAEKPHLLDCMQAIVSPFLEIMTDVRDNQSNQP